MRNILILFILATFTSCNTDILPKPKAYLSLEYPKKEYTNLALERPYYFEVLKNTKIIDEKNNWLKIIYPNIKASIDITEQIIPKDFLNPKKRVFGSLYEITGNAASQIQFHVTDSTHNFIKGSLYFYAKPNYDSILPAVDYIKKDILHIIETLEWQ